ncbi:NUDIX domain-containing protein [Actinosynnema sp. NPDC023658]|uniref:NUDIX domain-containing protein n=1 Tax=Actinosynnema sp. NPDC023658 TaxID=3155465 RepID=UPI00340C3AE3
MTDNEDGRRGACDLAVDVVLFAEPGGVLSVLAIERDKQPFRACLALPGGFVEAGEAPRVAAARELAEETGVEVAPTGLAEVGSYGTPGRDPRGNVVSIAYRGYAERAPRAVAASDARAARWISLHEFLDPAAGVAFDHRDIVGDALAAWLGEGRVPGEGGTPGTGFPQF